MDLREAIRLYEQRRLTEAESICRLALDENPADARASHLLGRIALQGGRLAEAVRWIGGAVAVLPSDVGFRVDLAAALAMSGRPGDAVPHLREAMRVRPDVAELHNNLGGAMEALGWFAEALAAYGEAIRLRPLYAEVHYNLGNVLHKTGRLTESAEAYRQALRLQPDSFKALNNLAGVAADLGDLDETLACYRRLVDVQPQAPMPHSALLYALHYHGDYDAAALHREHVAWGRRHAEPIYRRYGRQHANDRSPDRKLRVGYVSPDFRDHTVPRFIGVALEHHDREWFEAFLYSDVAEPDAVTHRLRGLGHAWRDVARLSDEELDDLIRSDAVDVLVDLRGHAAGNRMMLFARKPAPVQVTMVGYFDTTGLPTMDWRVTDDAMDPPGETERYYTERLARLGHTCWCYLPDEDAPDVVEPPVTINGHVTFGSLNKAVKISQPCARLWAAVLEAVPGSRLLLAVGSSDCGVIETVRRRLGDMGLPADRLDLVGKARTRREYFERFGRIDVALDTFPFNGITTTCDGLWMGVPAVSLAGATSVSRAGRSILRAAGLGDLAAGTPGQFVDAAARLARDPPRLRNLRLGMRRRMLDSPLTDHAGFTRRLEEAYRAMWGEWCRGGR